MRHLCYVSCYTANKQVNHLRKYPSEEDRNPWQHRLHRNLHPLHLRAVPRRYTPIALAAGSNLEAAFEQALRWRPLLISLATEPLAEALKLRLRTEGITDIEIMHGTPGTIAVATHPQVDFVVSAIVGVAGLEATYAAVQAGKTIGLANKECLVAAGDLIIQAARKNNVALLPSTPNTTPSTRPCAAAPQPRSSRSGSPPPVAPSATPPSPTSNTSPPPQALKHPTWVMGQRITIDSATMMNKGFEVIEACRLFDLPAAKVRVHLSPPKHGPLVGGVHRRQHPRPDIRHRHAPAHPLRPAYPERPASNLTFDLAALSQLDFSQPDLAKFPCLRLAYEAADAGPSACIALNAADEIAVASFLAGDIPFLGIPRTIERVLSLTPAAAPSSIPGVLAADQAARALAREIIARA